ncbi:DELTA-sagatoxin-Srs1a-like [Megalops cyprinoides]|uniref:DELTA-sagatoxin-Srs1a-like n=1 Tax=Megalops cyprinoides TaxID=118141 RepID=UPI0018641A6B|nr:DELTA-sagatoxin-Srs1a-like [Megalops cyprinoides]XP_036372317.1 DELTA-sagatoxin-Srs1a-like [Megalops cyprinoides]
MDLDPAQNTLLPGPSLTGTSFLEMSKSISTIRNVTIVIFNYTQGTYLRDPKVYTYSGYNHDPPQPTIKPRTMEACSFSKTGGTACGSVGVLTYDIWRAEGDQADGRLAVMFSVPFNYDFFKNMFAIGKFDTSFACDESLYKKMYYNDSNNFICRRGTGNSVEYVADNLTVKATMSPQAKSILKVEVWDT